MKTAMKSFWALTVFGLGIGTLYFLLSGEVVGSVLLWGLGVMGSIIVVWTARSGLSTEPDPSDDPQAEPGAQAGESLGSFPLVTAWPLILVLGVITIGASVVYGLILLPVGVIVLTWSILGLMRESHD